MMLDCSCQTFLLQPCLARFSDWILPCHAQPGLAQVSPSFCTAPTRSAGDESESWAVLEDVSGPLIALQMLYKEAQYSFRFCFQLLYPGIWGLKALTFLPHLCSQTPPALLAVELRPVPAQSSQSQAIIAHAGLRAGADTQQPAWFEG